MSIADLAWLCVAAYAVHMVEEFMLNWRDWARAVIRLPVTWPDFYVTNGAVVVLGIATASLAPTQPLAPLVFAALMLINAVIFHVLPVLITRGRYSPGVATAVLLFLPIGYAVFHAAGESGQASWGTVILAFAIGAALMALPIVLLHLRGFSYFQQVPPGTQDPAPKT
ncbi:MAG: HXXEE domain-containing protein [Hyphomicrobiales bacterium]